MKKANFSKLVMEVVMDFPEYYREKLSEVNLEIKDYPESKQDNSQIFLKDNKQSGDILKNKRNIIIYKWPMISVSENVRELKGNIKSAILSQSESVLGLSPKNMVIQNTEDTSLKLDYH